MKRRNFIKAGSLMCGSTLFGGFQNYAFADEETTSLTILHTNDVHSRIEPFPKGSKYAGLGGAAKRAELINKIRAEEENVLLLDAGDMIQGTPYFNLFEGELEMKLMNEMKYDACTIGNHDFDAGLAGLNKMIDLANFPFINSNYEFNSKLINDKILHFKTIKKGNLKIGIYGLGIELNGLVPPHLYENTNYINPLYISQEVSEHLRFKEKCDFIICLSHLGYKHNNGKVSDIDIALNTNELDLIIGGHTHTFMDVPHIVKNKKNKEILINQVGWAGINVGLIKIIFNKKSRKNVEKSTTVFSLK